MPRFAHRHLPPGARCAVPAGATRIRTPAQSGKRPEPTPRWPASLPTTDLWHSRHGGIGSRGAPTPGSGNGSGGGTGSHADVMLVAQARTLALESKSRERMYESVDAWLGNPRESNKEAVLGGWLAAINATTGSALQIAGVLACVYQLVHRTASA